MSDFDERARRAADAVRQELEQRGVDEKALKKTQRSPVSKAALPAALTAIALIAAGTVAITRISGDDPDVVANDELQLASLQSFDQCDAALDYFKQRGVQYFMDNFYGGPKPFPMPNARATAESDTSAAAGQMPALAPDLNGLPGGSDSSSEFSTTNVQEAGVDEPDIIKTDGRRIVAVAGGKVNLLDIVDDRPVHSAALEITGAQNVLLHEDRLLVTSQENGEFRTNSSRSPHSMLSLFDVSSFKSPNKLESFDVEGQIVDLRLVGSQLRVATTWSPDIDVPSPVPDQNGNIQPQSKAALETAIANSTISDWTPKYELRSSDGTVAGKGQLVECGNLSHPGAFSGLSTVAVLNIDIAKSLQLEDATGVIAGGQQVYATADNFYISSTEYTDGDGRIQKTFVHKFIATDNGGSEYRGSGEVPGTLLNQYAMSELDGVLRVASTRTEMRGWENQRNISEGIVTTLTEKNKQLTQLGQVGGLGKDDNESIRAVRFIGTNGYVVTFRQIDPLYVIDLRDPKMPAITGELKIPGYSGYLHPVGENILLGVGQGGTEGETQTTVDFRANSMPIAPTMSGVQFSLFDVSDPKAPRRIATQTYGGGSAAAEFDPKAFLFWQPRNLVIAPTNLYEQRNPFNGLILLQVSGTEMKEVGRLQQTEQGGTMRSTVIGNNVYMLSYSSLQVNSLDTHKELAKIELVPQYGGAVKPF